MEEVNVALFFMLASFAIGILKIIRLNKGLYLQDIRLFFLLSFALYSIFLPIASCVFPDILAFNEDVMTTTIWLYTSAVVGFDIMLFKYNIPWKNAGLTYKNTKSFKYVIYVLIVLVAYAFYYMYSQGVQTFALGASMDDRSTYGEAVHQSWIILAIVVATFFNYLLFHFKLLNGRQKFIYIACLLFYVAYQVSLGNRREYTTIILFFICYYLCIKRQSLKLKLLLFILVAFIGSFAITIIRDPNTRELQGNDAVQMALVNNEFIYPQQTTYFTVKDKWDYRYGYTYTILPIEIAIPRSIYPSKPPTLGTEFMFRLGVSQGYAYTPVTEAFLNFGYVGPFFIFMLLGAGANRLIRKVNKNGVSFLYIILYAYIFDFCRGEFSSVSYSLFFIYISYLFIRKLSSIYVGKTRQHSIQSAKGRGDISCLEGVN